MAKDAATNIERTSDGLRNALFDELDALRNGKSSPTQANAVAKLSASIVETVRMEIDVQRFAARMNATPQTPDPAVKSLKLG